MNLNHLDDDQLADAITAAVLSQDRPRYTLLAREADRRDDVRRARLDRPGALVAAAHWYAAQGIAVFPVQARDKKPYPGSRGFKDATCDTDRITAWWRTHPDANIGLPTGGRFDVIDIDGPDGARSLLELRAGDALPEVYGVANTARSCGRHLYVAATGDGNAAGLLPGIDYRGAGGYVLAPPSITTRRYEWVTPLNLAGLKALAVAA